MAEEFADRQVVLFKLETTEGTDAEPVAANARTYEEYSAKFMHTPRRRVVASPQQQGYRGFAEGAHVEEEFTALAVGKAISTTDATDAPSHVLDMQTCGWTLLSEAGTKTHTLILGSGQGSTGTLYHYRNDLATSESQRTIGLGMRGEGVFGAQAGQIYTFKGRRMGALSGTPRAPQGSAYTTAINLVTGYEFALESATVRIYDPAGAVLYSDGDLATPGGAAGLHAVEIDSLRRASVKRRAQGAYGVAGAQLDPDGALINVTLDVNKYTRINLANAALGTAGGGPIPLEFLITSPARGRAGLTQTIYFCAYVETIDDVAVADGIITAQLGLRALYPPDVTDNNPAAGLSPTQAATTGTNRGLPVIPSGLPTGVVYIQYRDQTA